MIIKIMPACLLFKQVYYDIAQWDVHSIIM